MGTTKQEGGSDTALTHSDLGEGLELDTGARCAGRGPQVVGAGRGSAQNDGHGVGARVAHGQDLRTVRPSRLLSDHHLVGSLVRGLADPSDRRLVRVPSL